jgi:Leucine-rich repeat (LRR) protein
MAWYDALVGARLQNGELNLCWKPELGVDGVNPLIFDENIAADHIESKKAGDPVQIRVMRLIGLTLRSLPETMGPALFPALQTLSLSNNELEYLPESFATFTKLKDLNIQQNKLRFLPERIGMMSSLAKFQVTNNCIEYLPSTFGALGL